MNRLPHSIARSLQAAAHPAAAPAPGRIKLGLGTPAALAFSAVGLIAAITLALSINSYYVFVLAGIALVAIVGIGLNVLIGLTGQVSFGHVGFYAVGAYTVAILTTKAGLSFWLAWPLAAVVAGALGVLLALPALRVKGPYLAMITIAFSFIIQHAIIELRDLTGGQNGIMGLAAPAFLGLQAERAIAVLGLITAAVVLAAYCWLSRGSWGAAMRAVRDSETAAESIGLNPLVIKTVAIARGLMSRPRVLLLDEPSLGLAPKVIAELFAALDQLRRENMTIVLVDQMAALALSLADRAYVIEGGRVVAQGTAAEIAANDALAKAYLGAH